MILRACVIGLLLLPGLCGHPARAAAPASASREIEAKVTLETSLEKRLQALLQKVLGTEDVVVMVNVELLPSSEQELMPGVPVKDTPGTQESVSLTMVKTLSAAIILDEKAEEKDVELVRKTAASVLGIQPDRGDRLTIEKMALHRDKGVFSAAAASPSSREPLLNPPRLLSLLWLFAAAGGLLLLNTRFLSPLLGVLRDMLAVRAEAATAAKGAAAAASAPAAAEADAQAATRSRAAQPAFREGSRDEEEDLPFAFIGDRHMPMLKVLMRKMDPRKAAVVVHYLEPRLAAQALVQLPPDLRREIIRHMSKVVQLSERQVRGIERKIHEKIEYLMGGEEKLAEIIDAAPSSLQEELLQTVAGENQVLGARLGTRIVLLDDIALLEAPELKLLTRKVPVQSLAAVLKSSPGLSERLLPKLTGGLGAWLGQEVELSRDLLPDALALEQRKVLAAMGQLVREGRIALRKAGISAEAMAAAKSGDMMEMEEVVDLSGMEEPDDEEPGPGGKSSPPPSAAQPPQPASLSSETLEKLMGMFAAAMGMAQARGATPPPQPAPQSWLDPFREPMGQVQARGPIPDGAQMPVGQVQARGPIPDGAQESSAQAAATAPSSVDPLPPKHEPGAAPAATAPFAPFAATAVGASLRPSGSVESAPGPLDLAADLAAEAPPEAPFAGPDEAPLPPSPTEELLGRLSAPSGPDLSPDLDDRIPDPPSSSGAPLYAPPDFSLPHAPGLSDIPEPPGFAGPDFSAPPAPPGFAGPDFFSPPKPPGFGPPAPPGSEA